MTQHFRGRGAGLNASRGFCGGSDRNGTTRPIAAVAKSSKCTPHEALLETLAVAIRLT